MKAVLENAFKESEFIDQSMVVGEGEKHVSLMISPNFEKLDLWCEQKGIPTNDREKQLSHPEVLAIYQAEVEERNTRFAKYEQVKKIKLLPSEWSVDGGELTPTLKLKRRIILEKYKDEYLELYPD